MFSSIYQQKPSRFAQPRSSAGIRGRGNGESGIYPKYHNFEVKKKDNEAEEMH